MNNSVKKGKRWTLKDKLLALRIMYRSPQAFKMLKRVFSLPARSTVLMFLKKSFRSLEPGFTNKVMALVKMRVDTMTKLERNCSLVFDEMSLKQHLDFDKYNDKAIGIQSNGKPVNQVLVLMVCGRESNTGIPGYRNRDFGRFCLVSNTGNKKTTIQIPVFKYLNGCFFIYYF